jgi:hypothetical protein
MAMGYAISRNKDAIEHAAHGIGNLISGYSGSAIEIPADTKHQASLSRILIADKKKSKAMVAVKIGPILAGIRNSLQEQPG